MDVVVSYQNVNFIWQIFPGWTSKLLLGRSRQICLPNARRLGQPVRSTHFSRLEHVDVNGERNILMGEENTRSLPHTHDRCRNLTAISAKDTGVSSVLGQNWQGRVFGILSDTNADTRRQFLILHGSRVECCGELCCGNCRGGGDTFPFGGAPSKAQFSPTCAMPTGC